MSVASAKAAELIKPPPTGAPYSVALRDSEKPGRTKVYRNWRYTDGLLDTLDPKVKTAHDAFEISANERPGIHCLGYRPFDPVTKAYGSYVWQTFSQVQQRRKDFGVGIAQLHEELGQPSTQSGVGLWCSNRPEWQIVGIYAPVSPSK